MESSTHRPFRIGLLGSYGSNNLGDTSIQMSVMHAIRKRLPQVSFFGFSWSAGNVAKTHRIPGLNAMGDGPFVLPGQNGGPDDDAPIPSSPWARAILAMLPRLLRRTVIIALVTSQLDALFISGSGQFDDFWGGPWVQPWRLFLWSWFAKFQGIPLMVVGVGFDEMHTRLGKAMVMEALRNCDFNYFRDGGTLAALQSLGFQGKSVVAPDPAFGFPLPPIAGDEYAPAPYAVVSPISSQAWPGKNQRDYEAYLDCLADLCQALVASGLEIRFCCSQIMMDPPVVDLLIQKLPAAVAGKCVKVEVARVEEFCRVAGGAELMVASRLHAIILSAVAGTPVFALAYSRKVVQLMRDLDAPDQCQRIAGLDREKCLEAFHLALSERSSLKSHIRAKVSAFRLNLEATYDDMVAKLSEFPPRLKSEWLQEPGGLPAKIPSSKN